MAESEQSNDQSKDAGAVKSIEDFKNLSLEDMEKELKAQASSSKTTTEEIDQDQKNSETSDEDSSNEKSSETTDTQEDEQTTEEDSSDKTEKSSEPDTSDNQKEKAQSDKKFDYEKAYKELQAEFTRRSQKLKELEDKLTEVASKTEKSPEKDKGEAKPSRLAQLKAKDPEAAALLEELIKEQVESQVKDRVKPVEEQVTLRHRKENAEKFSKAIDAFNASDLGPLQAELLGIWNENPSFWQQVVWDSEDAFEQLKKELIYRHLDKVTELRSKKVKETQSSTVKKDRLKDSQVATKTKVTQATKDVMSDEDFRKLPLSEMEKRLPKHRG